MRNATQRVDKLLGGINLLIAVDLYYLLLKTTAWSLESGQWFIGALSVCIILPAAFAVSYLGYMLLRYPPERLSSAEEIRGLANRQNVPITRLFVNE
jgi:hypothetical protein